MVITPGWRRLVVAVCILTLFALSAPAGTALGEGDTSHAVRSDAATALADLATAALGPLDGAPLADAAADTPAGVLHGLGIVHGRTDGTFGSEEALSRAQLASLAARLLATLRDADVVGGASPFSDVPATHPHAAGIAAAAADGLVVGRGDGTFGPAVVASRRHVETVTARLRDVLVAEGLLPDGDPLPQPVIVEFGTPEGSFRVLIDDPGSIDRLYGAEPGTHVGIPSGRILPGDGGVNTGRSWHLVDVEIVDMAMEICDGSADYIDRVGLDAWYETQGDRYCPWGAVFISVEPA